MVDLIFTCHSTQHRLKYRYNCLKVLSYLLSTSFTCSHGKIVASIQLSTGLNNVCACARSHGSCGQQWSGHYNKPGSIFKSSVEIWPALRRLEGKVDYLTRLLETSSNKFPPWQPPREMERSVSSKPRGQFPVERRALSEIKMFIPSNAASYVPAERWPQSEMEFIPTSNQPQSMEAEDNEISPDNQDGSLKKDSLFAIRARASSSMNFAVRLLREFFMPVELKGKNVSGSRGKDQLDPARIQKIKNYVYEFYPTPPSERDCVWRECRKAIDSYLRKTFR